MYITLRFVFIALLCIRDIAFVLTGQVGQLAHPLRLRILLFPSVYRNTVQVAFLG